MLTTSRHAVRSWLLLALVGIAAGIAYLRLWSFLADDAFISARYAQNLALGHGLVYNPGERVEGYTNFLWTLLLGIPAALHLGLVPFVKGLSALFALATTLATWRLSRELLRGDPAGEGGIFEVLPAVLFLAMPAVIVSAAEGLETMLFAFLLVWAVADFLAEQRRPGDWPRSATGFALLGMTRPDGAAFGVGFVLIALATRRPLAWTLRFAGTFVVLFGAYALIRADWYGQWFPNTFYAKSGGDPVLYRRGCGEILQFALQCGGGLWIAALPAFLEKRLRLPALVLAIVVVLRIAFQVWSGGAWMGRMRFLVPALPFLLVLAVAGLSVVLRAGRPRWIGAAIAAAIALTPGWLAYPGQESRAVAYGYDLQRAHGALGRHIAEHTSPEAVVAIDDAGLAPLLSGRRTIDMLGLNDAHIAHLRGRFANKYDVGYVLGRHPDLIVLLAFVEHPARPEDFRLPGHAAMFREPQFQSEYAFIRDYPFEADYHLLVYRRVASAAVPADF